MRTFRSLKKLVEKKRENETAYKILLDGHRYFYVLLNPIECPPSVIELTDKKIAEILENNR